LTPVVLENSDLTNISYTRRHWRWPRGGADPDALHFGARSYRRGARKARLSRRLSARPSAARLPVCRFPLGVQLDMLRRVHRAITRKPKPRIRTSAPSGRRRPRRSHPETINPSVDYAMQKGDREELMTDGRSARSSVSSRKPKRFSAGVISPALLARACWMRTHSLDVRFTLTQYMGADGQKRNVTKPKPSIDLTSDVNLVSLLD